MITATNYIIIDGTEYDGIGEWNKESMTKKLCSFSSGFVFCVYGIFYMLHDTFLQSYNLLQYHYQCSRWYVRNG